MNSIIIGDEFFVIDSNNFDSIETKLYGFIMDNGKIIRNENIEDLKDITYEGVYVYVHKHKSGISIFQDYNGSYGLYI